jgi:hypothetical protein
MGWVMCRESSKRNEERETMYKLAGRPLSLSKNLISSIYFP